MEKILRNTSAEPFPMISLTQIFLDELKKNPDFVALVDIDQNEELTKDTILQLSLRLAESFNKNCELTKGDCIAIICKNRWQFLVVTIACVFLKCTFSPLNPNYTKHELKHALDLLHPKLIVCESNLIPKIKSTGLNIGNNNIFSVSKHKNHMSIQEILKKERNLFQIQPENIDESLQRVCCVLFSSGTTGLPKGVMITNGNMAFSIISKKSNAALAELTLQNILPFFHSYGLNTLFNSLVSDCKMVFFSKFTPRTYLHAIEKYKVQILLIVPAIANFLNRSPLVSKFNLSSLLIIGCGGAPLSIETEKELSEKCSVTIVQGYGLTETTFGVTEQPIGELRTGSVGRIMPNMECKVVDVESGEILGANQRGELWFRGPMILKGYLKDQKATDELFDKDGFMRTGDIGYYDNDGYLFIVDRIKELIKYKGFQVPPAELEGLLLKHPGIQDAAVVGKPDPKVGELPVAFVVLNKQKSSSLTPEQIISYVAEHVSSEKQLRGGVQFVSEIPRNDAGKILRRKLKEKLIQKSKL